MEKCRNVFELFFRATIKNTDFQHTMLVWRIWKIRKCTCQLYVVEKDASQLSRDFMNGNEMLRRSSPIIFIPNKKTVLNLKTKQLGLMNGPRKTVGRVFKF